MGVMSIDREDFSETFNARPQKEGLAAKDFDILVDKATSRVWVLHEVPFINQNSVNRAEYSQSKHTLKFISHDGSIQYLDARVQAPLRPHLEKTREITALLTDSEGNINNIFAVPLKHTD